MSADEIQTAVQTLVTEKEITKIIIRLNETENFETFNAIKTGLSSAGNGTIDLTLLGVTIIPEIAFISRSFLRSIYLLDTTSVEYHAFYDCKSLEIIDLPKATILGGD